jgi:hypothetical protein
MESDQRDTRYRGAPDKCSGNRESQDPKIIGDFSAILLAVRRVIP